MPFTTTQASSAAPSGPSAHPRPCEGLRFGRSARVRGRAKIGGKGNPAGGKGPNLPLGFVRFDERDCTLARESARPPTMAPTAPFNRSFVPARFIIHPGPVYNSTLLFYEFLIAGRLSGSAISRLPFLARLFFGWRMSHAD